MKELVDQLIQSLCEIVPIIKKEKIDEGLKETLIEMFKDGLYINCERANIIMSFWHLPPMPNQVFSYYFPKSVTDKETLILGIEKFVKDALWHCGDLEKAYLSFIKVPDLSGFLTKADFNVGEFENRLRWRVLKNIDPKQRGYLGYVSGERPYRQKEILDKIENIIDSFENDYEKLKDLEPAKITEIILDKLREKDPTINEALTGIKDISSLRELDLFSSRKLDENKKVIETTKTEIENTIKLVESLKKVGKYNLMQYLRNINSIDVYVATSMRNDAEYIEMADFVKNTFNNEKLTPLNLRFFDPTLCYCESRIDKGIIECLLVRSAKVTIYCAQEGDTFGKDSELAATIVQGKPAIVYVPNNQNLDKRAKTFKEFHPLGLQIGLNDGVARGVIVVRTPEECATVLYNILTNKLETNVVYEEHGIVLRERITDSVIRVMTGWGFLSSSFWNNFDKTKSPKIGNFARD